MRFGDKWEPETEEKPAVDRNAKPPRGDPNNFAPPACTNTAVLGLAVVAFFLLNFSIFAMSGGQTATGTAKSLVFMFEGFKGTAFEQAVLNDNKAPNLKKLLQSTQGKVAHCISTKDQRCALTQSGARQGGDYAWTSAPGLASMLSGVNSNKHRVHNDSYGAMSQYGATSKRFPSFVHLAKQSGLRTAVVGSPHLLTGSKQGASEACTNYGVLDFECGIPTVVKCLRDSSCNTGKRISVNSQILGAPEDEAALPELKNIIEEGEADLIVVHIPRLAIVGEKSAFDASNQRYAAQIYLLDAYVGQILASLERRVKETREAWLVVGSGDHGGYMNTFGKTPSEDEVVPFFVTAVMADTTLNMNELTLPTKQFDVAPTVLRWLDLLDEETAANMDGKVQGICSDGKVPIGCDEAARLKAAASRKAAALEKDEKSEGTKKEKKE